MSIRRSVFFAFLAKYAETIIFTVGSIVLARVLTPEEIGVFSVSAAAIAVSSAVRDFGLGTFLLQAKVITPAVVRTVFWIGVIISTTAAVLMAASAPTIAGFYRDPRVADLIYIMAIGFLVIPFSVPVMARIKRNMDFVAVSKLTAIVGTCQIGTSIYLATRGYGPYALAWAAIVNIVLSTLLAFYYLPVFDWLKPDLSEWRAVVKFGTFASASGTVGELSRNAADLLIGRLTGFDAVAMFSRAHGVTDLFNRLFQDALGQIAIPAAAQSFRDGGDIKSFYLRATELLTAVSWPFFLVLMIVADEMVLILFGPQWSAVVVPAQILCAGRIISGLFTFVGAVLIARGAMNIVFRAQVAIMAANIVCVSIAAPLGLEALAVGGCIVQSISVVIYYQALNRVGRIEWQAIFAAVRPSFFVAIVTFAAALGIRLLLDNTQLGFVVSFLAVGFVSGLAWLSAIAAFGHPIWGELLRIVSSVSALRRQA